MKGYDFATGTTFENKIPKINAQSKLAIICDVSDIQILLDVFQWDDDTIEECTNIDETVRYTSYVNYDFISLIYADSENGVMSNQEINVFFSKQYFVLIVPDHASVRLSKLTAGLTKAIYAETSHQPLVHLYYLTLDSLATDYSDILEELEDDMEALSEAIERSPNKEQSAEIGRLRKIAYTYKKLLRALSYIGGQVLMDENNFLTKEELRYFRNIDTRLMRLYDFADNLLDLSNELVHTYESKFSAQMNEMINKLTIITLFFGPMTVIAGIYGMNFTNMPELSWKYGYPSALGLMLIISLIIFIILKKNKWL
jgi:magnesium transporter